MPKWEISYLGNQQTGPEVPTNFGVNIFRHPRSKVIQKSDVCQNLKHLLPETPFLAKENGENMMKITLKIQPRDRTSKEWYLDFLVHGVLGFIGTWSFPLDFNLLETLFLPIFQICYETLRFIDRFAGALVSSRNQVLHSFC